MEHLDLYGVLRIGVMLLAFLVAFYALIARERKSPSLINSIFYVTYSLLFLLMIILLLNINRTLDINTIFIIFLIIIVIVITYHILNAHNRLKNLRTDHVFKNLGVVRIIKEWRRRLRSSRTYEHYGSNITESLSKKLLDSNFIQLKAGASKELSLPITAIYHLCSHRESDKVLVDLSSRFLEEDFWVQYTTCSRHPIEFLSSLKIHLDKHNSNVDWEKISKKVVVVDACTPHFGFTDSIYGVRADDANKLCLELVKSKPSFAGIHAAAAEAFNKIKKQSGSDTREPTLVIYEGLHSLVDFESAEQYRIFYSHVLPSERLWGGMFTVVIEFSPTFQNLDHIRTYGDYFYSSKQSSKSLSSDSNVSSRFGVNRICSEERQDENE